MKNKKVYRVEIRLDYLCRKKLNAICKRTKLSKSAIIRKLILNEVIKEKPDEKFYELFSNLIEIGDHIQIIAEKAEYLNDIDKDKYAKDIQNVNDFITQMRLKYL